MTYGRPPIRFWLLVRLLVGIAALLVLAPAGASAALTASSIDTPTEGTHLFDDETSPSTVSISGTTTGSPAMVDIVCYNGTVANGLGGTADNVPVSGNAFSVSNAPLNPLIGTTCRLRAIEDSTSPPADP